MSEGQENNDNGHERDQLARTKIRQNRLLTSQSFPAVSACSGDRQLRWEAAEVGPEGVRE